MAVLLGYLALTTAYTFYLKRKMMIDVVTLASLYTLRVIGGTVAIGAVPSEWILAFSMFIFTSLALIKRYVELAAKVDTGLPDPTNRNYRKSDLASAWGTGRRLRFQCSDGVRPLYCFGHRSAGLYQHPAALWLICPILLYWVGRALVMAERRFMDDLIRWSSRLGIGGDRLLAFALIGVIMIAAA